MADGEGTRLHAVHHRRIQPQHFQVRSLNLTLQVDDPQEALAAARTEVTKRGGEVKDGEGNPDATTLNVVMPPAELEGFRDELVSWAHHVHNQSTGREDYGPAIREATQRRQRIDVARVHLIETVRAAPDHETADALSLLLEMTEDERRSLDSQLTDYEEQTRGSQIYVRFMGVP